MFQQIPESDWKIFRKLHPIAMERFAERSLAEMAAVMGIENLSAHDRYLKISELVEKRDRQLRELFDDYRRSTARLQLACITAAGLITEKERSQLTPETQAGIALVCDPRV